MSPRSASLPIEGGRKGAHLLYTGRLTGTTQVELARRLGVSQAQVARMEKRGYDAYSLNSLRRYVQALGEGFSLDIAVHRNSPQKTSSQMAANH